MHGSTFGRDSPTPLVEIFLRLGRGILTAFCGGWEIWVHH